MRLKEVKNMSEYEVVCNVTSYGKTEKRTFFPEACSEKEAITRLYWAFGGQNVEVLSVSIFE
jgi:hypothetical protein